ncbi:MAG: tetratricopeptide repeat protein [Phycisphaerae bacterium]
MNVTKRLLTAVFVAGLLASVASAQPAEDAKAKQFEDLLKKMLTNPSGASEKDAVTLLKLARQTGKEYNAGLAIKSYLSHNFRTNPELTLLAADNAFACGDYRQAAARYKSYLRLANGKGTPEVAAKLYRVLDDFLGDSDGLYQYMTANGAKYRNSDATRRFDLWYLKQARRRNDYANAARWLVQVYSDKSPAARKDLYFGPTLEWLADELTRANKDQFGAAEEFAKLAGIVEGDRAFRAKMVFYAANLTWAAENEGKEEKVADAKFSAVVEAAKDYINQAPTARTVRDVYDVLLGGHGKFSGTRANAQKQQRGEIFIHAFAKLDDADRNAILGWKDRYHTYHYYLATPSQMNSLAIANSKFFRSSPQTHKLRFELTGDLGQMRKLAAVLKDVPSTHAAAVNAFVATDGTDLTKAVHHLADKESWHLKFTDFHEILDRKIWPVYKALKVKNRPEPNEDYYEKVQLAFGKKLLLNSPIPVFDPRATRDFVEAAWEHADSDGKSKKDFMAILEGLAWVPYSRDDGREAFNSTYNKFKGWAQNFRKKKKDEVSKEQIELISKMEDTFRKCIYAEKSTGKAPNNFSAMIAEASAHDDREQTMDKFVKVAEKLYSSVNQWDSKRTPFGRATVDYLLNPGRHKGLQDFSVSVVEDQLKRYDHNGHNLALHHAVETVFENQKIEPWRTRDWYQGTSEKLSKAFGDALMRLLDKGKFSAEICDWFRGTRDGNRWKAEQLGLDVAEKLITTRALFKHDYRISGSIQSKAVNYMALVRWEFPQLARKYPWETAFDEMFIEEAKDTNYLDADYWEFGTDSTGKVIDQAVGILMDYKSWPLRYRTPDRRTYSSAEIDTWIGRALSKGDPKQQQALRQKLEKTYGDITFGQYAFGGYWFESERKLDKAAVRKEFFDRLKTYIARAAEAPTRIGPPDMISLKNLDAKTLTDDEIAVLKSILTDIAPSYWRHEDNADYLAERLFIALRHNKRLPELFELVGYFWKIDTSDRGDRVTELLSKAADSLEDQGQTDLAMSISIIGLNTFPSALDDDAKSRLTAVRSKSLASISGVIPVSKTDPRYSVFAAQAAYFTGKYDTAWEKYLDNRSRVMTYFKDLDPRFMIWLIDKNTAIRQFEEAETLVRTMSQWFSSVRGGFDPETRAQLALAEANIAFAREQYPVARAKYQSIANNRDFEGSAGEVQAQIKTAVVDRVTGRFDQAMGILEKLARRQDRSVQADAIFHMAWVKYAQKEYADAKDMIQKVFSLAPDHAQARLLEAKISLGLKELEEPTDILIGSVTNKRTLVPGMPLKVTLEDRNLSVVGSETNIELRAWTDGGDEEYFTLMPVGNSKTKFKGALPTELGPVTKDDHVLQVLGGGKVHFDLSERFRKEHKIEESRKQMLTVVTNSQLFASSGRILTPEEREQMAMEEMILKNIGIQNKQETDVALSTVRAFDQIKPGNRINVRVIDPDRSTTDKVDTLTVRAATASGDAIEALELTETDTHSGIFEGSIPTASGQAVAYASDSTQGREANFVISANEEYPAWVGLADNVRPKTFSVDLNDNLPLGVMTVNADVPGRKLKKFLVQKSLNGRDFQTIGAYNADWKPWDGSPRLQAVELGRRPGTSLEALKLYLEQGYLRDSRKKITRTTNDISGELDNNGSIRKDLGVGKHDHYVVHYRAAFYQDRRRMRSFSVEGKNAQFILAVNGRSISSRKEETDLKLSLGKGVHVMDLYVITQGGNDASWKVMQDIDAEPFIAPCPAEMFDPKKHPEITEGVKLSPATVTAGSDGQVFSIQFPEGTQTRIVRLLLLDFEMDAPAIRKISLKTPTGKVVLPTKEDFMSLRKNEQLEIVPGDRVTITYEDPSVLDGGKDIHESFLTATYANAGLSACFVEYKMRGNDRTERYIPMRRFKPGDRVNVFINDPDGDVSEKLDTLKFTARTSEGKTVELTALETAKHSGVFVGHFTPIEGKAERKDHIEIRKGDDIILSYMDKENTDPGIPWRRTAVIEQVWYDEPEMRIYDVVSKPAEPENRQIDEEDKDAAMAAGEELFPPTRAMLATCPEDPTEKPAKALIDGPVLVEITFPSQAQSPESTLELFVQTTSGRKAAGKDLSADGSFDTTVPGTIRLTSRPSDADSFDAPIGYTQVMIQNNPYRMTALDDGRFTFSVPVKLGETPSRSLVPSKEELEARGRSNRDKDQEKTFLAINGKDDIFVGFRYQTPEGQVKWLTRKIEMGSDAFFDIMERRYQEPVDGLYVGQTLYYRVVDKSRDTSDDKDTLTLAVKSVTGSDSEVELTETFRHSGIFKGLVKLAYADDKQTLDTANTIGVLYGDRLTSKYSRPGDSETELTRIIGVHKGSDGKVLPFTKRFKDPEIAVQTQFTVAEAYFELAKKHRELKRNDLAKEEIAIGKDTLENAIRDYPNTEARAQADYLLANLALEYADENEDVNLKKKFYLEAVRRFTDITSNFPKSAYAPKSQYKKAIVFEKMGQIDQACEEYVKLSYRYPDNELVPQTIARLGLYFLRKGQGMVKEAETLEDKLEKGKLALQSREMYTTAAEVFGRLAERFPDHKLAGKTTVRSAQCYMEAEKYDKAVETFTKVIEDENMDKDLRAEAMYWCGESHLNSGSYVEAYRMYKKCEWDFPTTKWAKFARFRLTDKRLAKVEQ